MRRTRCPPSCASAMAAPSSSTSAGSWLGQARQLAGQELQVADHVSERVVDLVRDTRGERSDRGEPVGQEQLLAHLGALGFRAIAIGHVASDEDATRRPRAGGAGRG